MPGQRFNAKGEAKGGPAEGNWVPQPLDCSDPVFHKGAPVRRDGGITRVRCLGTMVAWTGSVISRANQRSLRGQRSLRSDPSSFW